MPKRRFRTCRRNEPQTFLSLRPGPAAGVDEVRKLTLASILPESRRAEALLSWAVLWDVALVAARPHGARSHAGIKLRGATNLGSLLPGTLGRTGALGHGVNAAKPSNCGEPNGTRSCAFSSWSGQER